MFDVSMIRTDEFIDMPFSSKGLWFLLGMEADDEGFVSPKIVIRIYGGNDDDLKILIAKGYVIQFPSGVVVITDWNENNWLDSRRIKPTKHQNEKSLLTPITKTNRKYQLLSNCLAPAKPVESSIEESSIVESSNAAPTKEKKPVKKFVRPTIEEVAEYCKSRKNNVSPQKWFDYYESNGWRVGRNPMKDWKAAVRTWEQNNYDRKKVDTSKYDKFN